ncbi:beta-ketoacyl-ACP synthase III [Companilactobacillus nuruki]|uniref:Beta-ketoacyl-[acyl-carrier-protein] synthase III n=1 Tax=Companilactobacillus nuruki TaxID=1993540 RepID=A0A2N7AWA8_9LACO|nr:beta-ketoacyl-ACP synthase III [Companilactobacillus nuruki]PMD73037.1 3-oxoacyl-ACP synthase [Companilactobacillus nuruki]
MKFEDFEIVSTASYVPEKTVTNEELTKLFDTTDEWIVKRTGIHRRHVVTNETTSSLCTQVANQLLLKSNLMADEIDLIVVATMSPDYLAPSVSSIVQGNIKAKNAIAIDINTACSGFTYGLHLVRQLLIDNHQKNAILIGGENLSKLVDWNDRSTAVLFGDGAGGVLIRSTVDEGTFIAEDLKTLGSYGDYIVAGYTGRPSPFSSQEVGSPFFKMNGRKVYNFAIEEVPKSINNALAQANLCTDDIDFFLLHQANERIIKRISEKIKISADKFLVNIGEYGNTAAASEAILFDQFVKDKTIKRGNKIVFSGFGGGLSVGTIIIKY